jgi:hypothetical protein
MDSGGSFGSLKSATSGSYIDESSHTHLTKPSPLKNSGQKRPSSIILIASKCGSNEDDYSELKSLQEDEEVIPLVLDQSQDNTIQDIPDPNSLYSLSLS